MNNLTIKDLKLQDNFTAEITLSNNKIFVFDIKPYFQYTIFKPMQNLEYFKQAKFKGELLYWDDMHDFPLHCMNIPPEISNAS